MFRHYFRVAAAAPKLHLGNVSANCEEIEKLYLAQADKADLVLTPELSLTGYTCADLFGHRRLLDSALSGLERLRKLTETTGPAGAILTIGLPIERGNELFNCAALLHNGHVIAVMPKVYLPNYSEFYEKRWFSAGFYQPEPLQLANGIKTIFGNRVLVDVKGENGEHTTLGVEICEDAWTPISPGRTLALQGAEVILNLSASNEVIGKAAYRKSLVSGMSSSCICGYAYASAGRYESTSDIVFGGHILMYERGKQLGEVAPFRDGTLICDFSLNKIRHDRIANRSFADCKHNMTDGEAMHLQIEKPFAPKEKLQGKISMTPFVPSSNKLERCLSIFEMQVAGLQRRVEAINSRSLVIGVSGGLDSTLALLVAAQAVRNLGLPSTTVLGITMPGFGTTKRTKGNAEMLMELLGCEIRTISIVDATRQHFADIGHDESVHDITYENCQARERTQILMDVANQTNGFVVGTGDLSELALGWCTYNGDHMSMYAVNASIPKTLVRTLVDEIGHHMDANGFKGLAAVIEDIIDTPVSPELLPPKADGTIAQKTEDTIGSYILHDFFLYHHMRFGTEPAEVELLCKQAVSQSDVYHFSDEEIHKWLLSFYRRFFRQQFKRNCMPDAVKVGSVSLSPRGDLRLPSEIDFSEFLRTDYE